MEIQVPTDFLDEFKNIIVTNRDTHSKRIKKPPLSSLFKVLTSFSGQWSSHSTGKVNFHFHL